MSSVCEMRMAADGPARRPRRGWILTGGVALSSALTGALARSGHHVRVAADSEGVLDALERERFDLVLLDLQAPEIDAIATVKLYRYLALGEPQPQIVAVAERRGAEDAKACREAGIEVCLTRADAARAVAGLVAGGAVTGSVPEQEPGGATVSDIAMHPRFRPAPRAAD